MSDFRYNNTSDAPQVRDQVVVARRYRGVRPVDIGRTGTVLALEGRLVGVTLDHGNGQPRETRKVAPASLRRLARGGTK